MAGYIGSKASVVSSGVERKKTYSITGSTTSLTGLNYTVGKVHVYQNGVRLLDGTDYTATNGTSITLTVAAQSGDNVVVVSQASFQLSESYTSTEADAEFVTKAGDSMTGNLSLGDNNKAIFGAGSDLQIYHDGSNSYISDQGTGNLKILGTSMNIQSAAGENYIEAVNNAHVKLFYDAAEKLATTATGIDVTGTVTSDGLTVDGQAIIDGGTGVASSGVLHVRQNGNGNGNGIAITSSHATSHRIWKDANGKLNIGPASSTSAFVQDLNGNVGIGTSSPTAKLQIDGTFSIRSSSNQSFNDSNNANNLTMTDSKAHFNIDGADKDFQVSSDNLSHALFVQGSDGNVGIGTSSPTSGRILDANGQVRFQASNSGRYFDFVNDSAASYLDVSHALNIRTNGASSLTTAMTIDTSGRVTTPSQPAFSAWHNAGSTITSSGGIIVWNSTHCNIGGHYSNNNGRFTAPVAGRYLFSWTTLNRRPTAQIASLYKNGSNIWSQGPLLVTPSTSGNHEATLGSSVIISMSANDYVDVRAYHINGGDIYYGYGHANFMGYLLG